MFDPNFRNFSVRKCLTSIKGVTIIELLLGTTVFLVISYAAYKVYTKNIQTSQTSQQQSKYSRELKTFVERFRHQIENSVQLPNAEDSLLKLSRPDKCWDVANSPSVPATDTTQNLAWGMIPYPGKDKSAITNSTAAFEPSAQIANNTTNPNDGLFMVYNSEDSTINYLAFSDVPNQILDASTGTQLTVEGTAQNLEVGDFAVVADAVRKDLIRITGKTVSGGNTVINHDNKSIWNQSFANPMSAGGVQGYGRPMIFKVKLATYALDSANQNLMQDSHNTDDDFNATSKTFGTPGLKLKWDVVVPHVTQFQVYYVITDDTETRTPQMGIPSTFYPPCGNTGAASNCGCGNELGDTSLKTIKVSINYSKPQDTPSGPSTASATTSELFNPILLKKALPLVSSDHAGCTPTNILYTTLSDGTPNNDCGIYCICSSRSAPSLCASLPGGCPYVAPIPNTGSPGFGGGGTG